MPPQRFVMYVKPNILGQLAKIVNGLKMLLLLPIPFRYRVQDLNACQKIMPAVVASYQALPGTSGGNTAGNIASQNLTPDLANLLLTKLTSVADKIDSMDQRVASNERALAAQSNLLAQTSVSQPSTSSASSTSVLPGPTPTVPTAMAASNGPQLLPPT